MKIQRIVVFVTLNFMRFLTCIAILLAAASEISLLVRNLKDRKEDKKSADGFMWLSNPGIPTISGSVFAFAFTRVIKFGVLLVTVLSELPLPAGIEALVQKFYNVVLPEYKRGNGVSLLGLVCLFFGVDTLGQKITGYERTANWILFGAGSLNFLLGVLFSSSIHQYRSSSYLDEPPTSLPTSTTAIKEKGIVHTDAAIVNEVHVPVPAPRANSIKSQYNDSEVEVTRSDVGMAKSETSTLVIQIPEKTEPPMPTPSPPEGSNRLSVARNAFMRPFSHLTTHTGTSVSIYSTKGEDTGSIGNISSQPQVGIPIPTTETEQDPTHLAVPTKRVRNVSSGRRGLMRFPIASKYTSYGAQERQKLGPMERVPRTPPVPTAPYPLPEPEAK